MLAVSASQPRLQEVMFVDARVPEPEKLERALAPGTGMVMIDARRDGLQQVADWLDSHRGASRVALVAHGAPGELQLGARTLDAGVLNAEAVTLARIGRAMAPGAELQVYGCDTGAGERGALFVDTLATLTGRGTAASDDMTGTDGDWDLEVVKGHVEAAPMLSAATLDDYTHDLAIVVVTSGSDSGPGTLRQAIANANDGDTISFSDDFVISLSTHASGDSLLVINKSLTIDGDLDDNGTPDVVLDGHYNGRVLDVAAGHTVVASGLVIEHGLLSGDGGDGTSATALDGGDALGAGIRNAGTLTLKDVTVTGNRAAGGGGGSFTPNNNVYGDSGRTYGFGGGGGGGYAGIGGGDGGAVNITDPSGSDRTLGGSGVGGTGGMSVNYSGHDYGGGGGSTTGGVGAFQASTIGGGSGGTAGGIGGGGGGWSNSGGASGRGGDAAGGIFNSGTLTIRHSNITDNAAAGGGGAGPSYSAGHIYVAGAGGVAAGAILNRGILQIDTATIAAFSGNAAAGGERGQLGEADPAHPAATSQSDAMNDAGGSSTTLPSSASITSATYNAATGVLTVTGTDMAAGDTIDVSRLTVIGQGGNPYTLTSADVTADSATSFTITLNAADKLIVNGLLNKNGTNAVDSTTFNLVAGAGWDSTAGASADLTYNNITVSNVAAPTITSATYDASTHVLTVTGTNLVATPGANNDITVSKLTLRGEDGDPYALTSANVDVTSATSFSVTLNAADREQVAQQFNKNGTSSTGGASYLLSAVDDWDSVIGNTNISDAYNVVTVSNVPVPAITSATYDVATGKLVVTGTGFASRDGATNDVVANKFTFTGEGGATYALHDTGNFDITSSTSFTLDLSATDQAELKAIFNKNGTSSTGGTTYNLAAADDWAAGADAPLNVADSANGITVSNVAVPTITSATYDAATGQVVVTGTGFLSFSGTNNDIVANKFTFTGEGGDYTLTNTANVDITSGTIFKLTLSAADKAGVDQIINKNGTSSTGGTTYNIAAAEDWAAGADAAVITADKTGNGITVSNVAVPAITSATYDAATGIVVVTGTGFLSSSGTNNDIVANKFTFTGEGGAQYTLTDTANVDISSSTSFTLILSATDKAAVDQIINQNGTSSTGGTTYNIAAHEDWAAGADAAVAVADTTGNPITASNVDASAMVTPSGGSTAFVEGTPPVAVDSGLTVTDPDSASLASATVRIIGGFHSGEDMLAFANDGSSMGNITATYDTAHGVMTLTSAGGTARLAQWQAALRSITYADSSQDPNPADRTISFIVNDGIRDSAAAAKTVSVTGVNDAPMLSATANPAPQFTEGGAAVTLFAGASVDTVEAGQGIHALTLTVAGVADGTAEILGVDGTDVALTNGNNLATGANGYTVAVSVSGGTTTVTITRTGDYSTAAAQALVNGLTYRNTSDNPTVAGGRTITLASLQDNGGNVNGGVDTATPNIGATVVLTAVNDAPVVVADGGSVAFMAGDNTASLPVVVDGGLTVSDADNASLASAIVRITGGFHAGEDVLMFTNDGATMGNITASYDASEGKMALASAGGTATLAQWQAALRSVTYTDTAITPDTTTRTVSFFVNDGEADSAVATRIVTVTATDQTPIVTTRGGTTNYVYGTAPVTIDGEITVTDLDNATQSNAVVSIGAGFHSGDVLGFTNDGTTMGGITASYNAFTGVLTLTSVSNPATNAQWASALSSVTFSSTSTSGGNRTIAFAVNDGVKTSAVATDTVILLAPPEVTDVSSTTPDGGYKIGDTINLTVTFDQTVVVDDAGGTPTLLLETGGVDHTATYVSGSGTNTLTFAYAVQAGDASPDLDYASTSALALEGGTIRSGAGIDAVLTLPATGGPDSIAGQHAIVVDGVAPTVTVVGVPGDATYGYGQNLDFIVDFDEAVSVTSDTGTPRLAVTLDTGGTVYANYHSGSGSTALVFRMTVAAGQQDLDGITLGSMLETNGGTIRDSVGNDADTALNGVASTAGVLVDALPPELALSLDDERDYARYGRMLDYVVTISNTDDTDAATGVALSGTYSAGLVAGLAQWQCFGGGTPGVAGVPHCDPATGTGALASTLDLPSGTSLSFLVSVPVDVAASDADVRFDVTIDEPIYGVQLSADDTDTLVLFHDGFDVPYADGTQSMPPAAGATIVQMPCAGTHTSDAQDTPLVDVPARAGEGLIDRLYEAGIGNDRRMAVQRLNLDARPWVRLFVGSNSGDRVSPWAVAEPGTALALGLGDDGNRRWLLLEGRQASLHLPLSGDNGDPDSDACR